MNRRRFVAVCAGMAGVAGCNELSPTGAIGDEEVGLRVRNVLSARRTVTVEASGVESDDRYGEELNVMPGRVVTRANVLEAGSYHVEVSTDEGEWQATEWRMDNCETSDIHVVVGEDGIGIAPTCYNP